ncbi:MAG: hypothetical protein KF767_13030 [Bdellovibrionaceae bacterium]|nr:hypothetical protein [Pseudobdellovibrionaceae bacterium]
MRKALGIVLGVHLLATGMAKAESDHRYEDASTGRTIVAGAGVTLMTGGALMSRLNVENMLSVYQRHAVKAFETTQTRGVRLDMNDIDRVARGLEAGDEVRITYRTSDAEERKIRISQIEKRKGEINAELGRLRTRLLNLTKSNAAMQLNGISMQIRDNMIILSDLDKQIVDLRSGATVIDMRSATRVVDMNQHSVRQLEMFLLEKSRAGKNVLAIERVPRAARMEIAQMKRMMRGNIIVAVVGGAIIAEELVSGFLGDSVDSMIDSSVYVPVLEDATSAEQAQ